mmetsp:Transcript_82091/g.214179  ORF Transcript_82091/g.214179 Transcript_82091/m.214179 type:complete len:418 (-) Transcript_82091:99-1352(-)
MVGLRTSHHVHGSKYRLYAFYVVLLAAVRCMRPWRCFTSGGSPRATAASTVAGGFRIPDEKRWRTSLRAEADPLAIVSPEMRTAGQKYAQKLEDCLLSGRDLWKRMNEQGKVKKLYFIGPKGNLAEEVAESMMDAFSYVQAADGTMYMQRSQHVDYAPFDYHFVNSDKKMVELCRQQRIDHVELFSDDEAKYREMETDILKKFTEYDVPKPCAIVLGESALNVPENAEFLKEGLVIHLRCSPEASWKCINMRPAGNTGLYISTKDMVKPPIWALAQDMTGDIDNVESKKEYVRIVTELDKEYETVADISFSTDVRGISENSMWAVPKLVGVIAEHLGIETGSADQADLDSSLEKELTEFLENSRLSKYLDDALKWCDEQGAASIEDIVENPEDFVEAMGFKPLERKRFDKACALASE